MLVLIIISLASSDFERLGDPWDYHDSVTKFLVKGGYVVEVCPSSNALRQMAV